MKLLVPRGRKLAAQRRWLPPGLYALLLVALCALTVPELARPLERLLVGTVCFLPRWFCSELAPTAPAAPHWQQEQQELRQWVAGLSAEVLSRLREQDLRAPAGLMQAQFEPVWCHVVACEPRRGGGGEPCELVLDHTLGELWDCSEWVTKGEVLLGTLVRPRLSLDDPAAAEALAAPARVQLLNHPAARNLAAAIDLPDNARLRLVVRPAAIADPAALRVELWDDPYRSANLERGGHAVRTFAIPGASDQPDAGWLLGRTRIWGYETPAGDRLMTIGVYVVPPTEPRAISHVVVWRPHAAAKVPPPALPERRAARLWPLPGHRTGRSLLAAAEGVPEGAAVLVDGVILGTARAQAFGMALVSTFAASRQPWSLVLMPEDGSLRTREIVGRFVGIEAGVLQFAWRGEVAVGEGLWLPSGLLFTGSNGPHCPAGLLVGRARPHPQLADRIEVVLPATSPHGEVQLLRGSGGQ